MLDREALPWIAGALAVVVIVALALWLTRPEPNQLPEVYEVM